MSKKRSTLRDVAQKAGVTTSTVSRILNDKPMAIPITEATRERVMSAALELSYQPNRLARGLADSQTHILGLSFPITSRIEHVSHTEATYLAIGKLVSGIQSVAQARGYELHIFNRIEHREDPDAIPGPMYTEMLDGLLYVEPNPAYPYFKQALDSGLPMVVMGADGGEMGAFAVADNNRGEFERIVTALIRKGHRRVAFLAAAPSEPPLPVLERIVGYRRAHEAAGVAVDKALILDQPMLQKPLRASIVDLLKLRPEVTALIISRQEVAPEVLALLNDMDVRVPEDMEVIVIGDDRLFDHANPPLTAMRIDYFAIAAQAARLLVDVIEGKEKTPRTVIMPWEYIERDSCRFGGFLSQLNTADSNADEVASDGLQLEIPANDN